MKLIITTATDPVLAVLRLAGFVWPSGGFCNAQPLRWAAQRTTIDPTFRVTTLEQVVADDVSVSVANERVRYTRDQR